ncbi:MAG: DUF4032 domain-containing protein [Acidimicrobiia bacterium]|nr:DUF4032 domain-containing protein [Acidimicrobiia bacterium]
MPDFSLTVRAGHPDFLELPWEQSIVHWDSPRLMELPKGISRHEVRFLGYDTGIYAVKELPARPARNDYRVLRALEDADAPAVTAVGLVEHRAADPNEERSAALITKYVDFSFSYRELLEGAGFGPRRRQMLAAFAGLLVELHLAGCFWGDCSLSNVLYRYDAAAIEAIMVDAETASLHEQLTVGQREEDVEIMIMNVAGGMSDIAAAHGVDVDDADLALGEEIADWYRWLWEETTREVLIKPDERYLITERINRLNELGFTVDEVDLAPADGGSNLRMRPVVRGRVFNTTKLRELAGVEASEWQARQILGDLYHFTAQRGAASSAGKAVSSIQWRVSQLEPMLDRIRRLNPSADPIQGFCDFLHFRYVASHDAGFDIGNDAAYDQWVAAGLPGFPFESEVGPASD